MRIITKFEVYTYCLHSTSPKVRVDRISYTSLFDIGYPKANAFRLFATKHIQFDLRLKMDMT